MQSHLHQILASAIPERCALCFAVPVPHVLLKLSPLLAPPGDSLCQGWLLSGCGFQSQLKANLLVLCLVIA